MRRSRGRGRSSSLSYRRGAPPALPTSASVAHQRGRRTWVRSRGTNPAIEPSTQPQPQPHAPILKGPTDERKRKTWKRVPLETENETAEANIAVRAPPILDESDNSNSQNAPAASPATTAVSTSSATTAAAAAAAGKEKVGDCLASEATGMKRRGMHQLVRPHRPQEVTLESTTINQSEGIPPPDATDPGTTSSQDVLLAKLDQSYQEAPTVMQKRGRNQLVLSTTTTQQRRENVPTQQQRLDDNDGKWLPDRTYGDLTTPAEMRSLRDKLLLKKRGRNKLVLATTKSDSQNTTRITGPPDDRNQGGSSMMNTTTTKQRAGLRSRRRGENMSSSGPAIKRIKLNVPIVKPDGSIEQNTSEEPTASAEDGHQDLDQNEKPKQLTEFAYRETSKLPGRGRRQTNPARGRGNQGWVRGRTTTTTSSSHAAGAGAPRNMGLVRVPPDLATTPICATFLRGIPCTDETCTKRHDVPKEAATPICSFFQRNGQCLKRDTCPFLHVKVNVNATVCPSFSLLGFCQDKDCRMKHIRVASKSFKKRSELHKKTS